MAKRICSAEGCGRPHKGLGLCSKHLQRLRAERRHPRQVAVGLPGERWRAIPGQEGHYEVSDLGRVRSIDRTITASTGVRYRKRGRMLSPAPSTGGHLMLHLRGRQGFLIHRLVLLAFVGPPPPGTECCHGPGGPADNRLVNLRWDTRVENMADRVRHGTLHPNSRKTRCNYRHLLTLPNLIAAELKQGRRKCLACGRARSVGQKAAKARRPFDFHAVVAQKYAEIMGVETDGESSGGGRMAS